MSDTDKEDYKLLRIFPDIKKEYQRWLNMDISDLMLGKKANSAPSTDGKKTNAATSTDDDSDVAAKRRKGCSSRINEDFEDDIIIVEDPLPETACVTRSRGRRRGRARQDESTTIVIEDSLPEVPPIAHSRKRGHGRRGNITEKTDAPTVTNKVPHVIKDSDDESVGDLNVSLDSEDITNYEMSVKVRWKSKDIHRFKIRKFQMMKTIFKFFSELESVPENKLLFTLKDKQIQPNDTPDSLQLSIVDFIDGGVTTISTSLEVDSKERQLKDGEIELKILFKDKKKPLTVTVQKDEKLLTLKTKVAEILELPREKLKFIFDGEALKSDDTPTDLDLEGGECIDVNIIV